MLKHSFTHLTTPVPAFHPTSAAMTGEVSKRNFANSKDCVLSLRYLCDPEQFVLPPLMHLLRGEDICFTLPSCCWREGICHHQQTQMCGHGGGGGPAGTVHSSQSLPTVWSADSATKESLSRSSHGEACVHTGRFISDESCQA